MTRNAHVLLVPRARPGRSADFATRGPVIANQRSRARRVRQARRSLRVIGRVLLGGTFLAAFVVVAAVTGHWLRTTPLLAVTSVEVRGTRRLAASAVRAAAAIPPGAGLLTLDPGATRARVEGLPGVERAQIVLDLPHRVTVVVEEREPYALVHRRDADRLVWVDATGHVIGDERRPGAPSRPILSGVELTTAASAAAPPERLRLGLALLRAIERTGRRVGGRISEIDLAAAEGPILYLTDGTEVRLGAEAWDERLARLDGVLSELERTGERVASVDLRFRDQVVLRPRETQAGPDARPGAGRARRRTATTGGAPGGTTVGMSTTTSTEPR